MVVFLERRVESSDSVFSFFFSNSSISSLREARESCKRREKEKKRENKKLI